MAAPNHENSLLFSLDALLKREAERVAEDAERERERARAKEQAELERRTLAAAQAEQREAERRRAEREAELSREERAHRLEAMKRAEVERARVEAEARARRELETARQDHERKLAEIQRATTRSRDRFALIVSGVLWAGAGLSAAAVYFAWLAPSWQRERTAYETELSAARAAVVGARAELERERERTRELSAKLDHCERPANPSFAPSPEPRAVPGVVAPRAAAKPPKKRCTTDGDPLDGCLP